MVEISRLQGLGVLVTRPAEQAASLCGSIEAEGGKPIRFPVLEILDPLDDRGLIKAIDRLESYDWAVFVSINAVQKAMGRILAQRDWPDSLRIAAIGKSSARELARFGQSRVLYPASRFNSEGLLALPDMQHVRGKRVVIFRGGSGRDLLADALRERGAEVEYVDAYRRVRPDSDSGMLLHRWDAGEIDIVVVNSVESLQNLYAMVGEPGRAHLLDTPLLVVSDRIVADAERLGFNRPPVIAENASDDAVLAALANWWQKAP